MVDFSKETQNLIIRRPFKSNVILLHPFRWSLLEEKKIEQKKELKALENVKGKVVMTDASIKEGITESKCSELKIDELIQFERLGFVRIDNPSPFVAFFAHH